VRFLVDSALSPVLCVDLQRAGHDAVHVRDVGLQAGEDEKVFERAAAEGRILVSADTDFGAILALRQAIRPSLILFRTTAWRRALDQAALLLDHMDVLEESLERGCIAIIEETRIRVRLLPIGGEAEP
jgi:predicted nuclease of predicted toxin-antitoxin system